MLIAMVLLHCWLGCCMRLEICAAEQAVLIPVSVYQLEVEFRNMNSSFMQQHDSIAESAKG